MSDQIYLVHLAGYHFFQVTFAVAVCCVAYIFLKYWLCLLAVFIFSKCCIELLRKLTDEQVNVRGRGVFITGCDTGFWFVFARHLDELGFTVFAGCLHEKGPGARRLKAVCSKRLHVLEVNVTKDKSVANAYQYVRNNLPKHGLWAVINNAGMNMLGELELLHVAVFERVLGVNLYGVIRVTRTFLPLIRKSKGRIVNISSVHGWLSHPKQSVYAASKHGVETLSDSLRLEMKKFGVSVVVVEPGMFGSATSINDQATHDRYIYEIDDMRKHASPDTLASYSKRYMLDWLPAASTGSWPPLARTDRMLPPIEHALCSVVPKTRYMVSGTGRKLSFVDELVMLSMVYRILPTWVMDWVVSVWTGYDKGRAK